MITLQDVLHWLFSHVFFLRFTAILLFMVAVMSTTFFNVHNNTQIITFLIHGHFYDLNKNRKTADESIYFNVHHTTTQPV